MLCFLSACSETSNPDSTSVESKSKEQPNEALEQMVVIIKPNQHMKVYVEQELRSGIKLFPTSYKFSGFVNEDTLAFAEMGYQTFFPVYIPAIKGHQFVLRGLWIYQFEIVDFNRQEGYVELKAIKQTEHQKKTE